MRRSKKKKFKYFPWIIIFLIIAIGLAFFMRKDLIKFNSTEKSEMTKPEKEKGPVFPDYNDTAIESENGMLEVTNPGSDLVLVNKNRKLPDGYEPADLTYPIVPLHGASKDKTLMRKEAAHALENLFQTAEASGIILTPVSAYRSYDRQLSLYNFYLQTQGEEWTQAYSAVPGTSEHQTGLSIDVSSPNFGNKLEAEFGETKEGVWLSDHAHEFGFVIRYPEDKVEVTGYHYEPWHIRYVGKGYATYLFEKDLVLEEVMTPNK